MAQIEIPFGPGEKAWVVTAHYLKQQDLCPDCAGSKVVRMVLGSGETHALECEQCRSGYEPPRGYVTRTICEYLVLQLEVDKFSIDEKRVRYMFPGVGIIDLDRIFANEADARKRAIELAAEQQRIEDERFESRLRHKRRERAWSVTYLRRERRRIQKELEAVEKRLNVENTTPTAKTESAGSAKGGEGRNRTE